MTAEQIDGFTDLDFADYFEPLPVVDAPPADPKVRRIIALKKQGMSSQEINALFDRERANRKVKGARRGK